MSKLTLKFATVGVAIVTVATLSGPVFAQTSAAAQIAALMAQIQALQSQLGSTTASTGGYNFAKNLTLGSKGADVKALQGVLISGGYLKISAPTSFFGPATKAAVIAWQKAVGISPASGFVGPLSRAQLNAAASTTTGGTTTTTGGTTAPAGSGLSVAVSPTTPAAGNFPGGASQVPFLELALTAGSKDVTVTGMNVYRGGISSDNDVSNVYLMSGSSVLATNIGLSNGKAVFSQASGLFVVKAGTTRKVMVAADISSSNTTSHTFTWSVNSAADINSVDSTGAALTETGAFPFTSAAFSAVSVSNPSLATLTLNNVGTGTSVNAGQTAFLAGQFTLQGSNSSINVRSIKLTETGTINAASDLANIKLMNGTTQVGATMTNLNSDGTVVFDLSNAPLLIPSGQTITLSVYADVVGGVNRNFKFTFQRAYDVVATDLTYNVGATVTAIGGLPLSASTVNVNAGTLVVTRDANSPINYIVAGQTNQTLASFDFAAAGEAVRITSLNYQLAWTGSGAETTAFNNLKLVDDQGVQIGTIYSSGAGTTPKTISATNLNYIIPAGTTRILSIKADVAASYTGTLTGTLNAVTGGGQGYTSLATVNIPTVAGNPLSTVTTPFGFALNNAVGTVTTVSGAQNVKVGSFALSAGASEGVNVSTVSVTTGAGAAAQYQNLKAMVGTTQIGTTQATLANNTQYTFSASQPINIPAGGSVVVDVYANTIAGATSSAAAVSLTGASATGAVSNSTRTASPASVTGQTVTVNANGTLTPALAALVPASQYVGMGAQGVTLGSFKLSADNNEPLNVTSIAITATTTRTADISNIRLVTSAGAPVGSAIPSISATSGVVATFTLPATGAGSLQVPQNNYVTVNVLADIGGVLNTGVQSADTVTVNLGAIQYQGAQSSVSATYSTSTQGGVTYTIYKTTLNVAQGAAFTGPTSIASGNGFVVGQFAFTAGGYDATVKTVTMTQAGSVLQASSSVPLAVYASNNPTVILATSTATSTAFSFTLNGATGWTVPAGSALTLIVKINGTPTNTVSSAPASGSYQISLSSATWNDGAGYGGSAVGQLSPNIATPIGGQSLTGLPN